VAYNYKVFGHYSSFSVLLKKTAFRKLDLFPSSDEGGDIYSDGSLTKR
jgi:hypothetical protein